MANVAPSVKPVEPSVSAEGEFEITQETVPSGLAPLDGLLKLFGLLFGFKVFGGNK